MNFNRSAAPELLISTKNIFDVLPLEPYRRQQLYPLMAMLCQGTTSIDKERGFRDKETVAGYGVLEPYFRRIPQAAIDDKTIQGVRGVSYDFAHDHTAAISPTKYFFEWNLKDSEPDIQLTLLGEIMLLGLEQELSHHSFFGTIEQYITRQMKELNQKLAAKGYEPIAIDDVLRAEMGFKVSQSSQSLFVPTASPVL